MSVKISSFEKEGRTHPTIELRNSDSAKYGFTFGVAKAKLILENVGEIESFVKQHYKTAQA